MPHARSKDQFDNSQHPAYEGLSRVTYSGLTNALDGVASGEERITFMTTNHYNLLDKGLIRPGRVDVQQEFGNCTASMLETMFRKFYEQLEGVDDVMAAWFRKECTDLGRDISPAEVQDHLLLFKTQPDEAIRQVRRIRREAKKGKTEQEAEEAPPDEPNRQDKG